MIRRLALGLVRRLRARLRGPRASSDDSEPANILESRDPETGELYAFLRPMTAAEARAADAEHREPRWLDRRGLR
jgi:hypothetical protein